MAPPSAAAAQSAFDPGLHHAHDSASCPFCRIAVIYGPYDPADPPAAESDALNPDASAPNPATFVVLSTPLLVAFLDIMPLSRGHVLLCPREHRPKLTDVTAAEAQEMGGYLRVLSAAVAQATGVRDWNVVQNNGAAAAQVVPHCHFHIIPRPELRDKRSERFTATMFGRGTREDLDEDEAAPLAERIREAVAELLHGEAPPDSSKPKL
ncbi:HIT-like domain-containing protein [Lasiosphaeria miniovina]|uniref:HIT-like domain-containing protein n=1 Tax=Lasiosphaeria miniovina TaxID=1954250 RepID=A0AA40ATD1_9PEZI|nr:HIT-like domain-containing protein [Lasiosphaeria miniovina]KAK0721644.1 HIT-like domain-containing protein [Lasiosphaeria miniovina]